MSATLRLNIDDTQTTIDILDTSNFPVDGGVVQIEDEIISYTRATSQGITGCTRGYDSTSADSHLAQLEVSLLTTPLATESPLEFSAVGAPTDNLTGVKIAPKGTRYTNTTTGDVYLNTGTADEPTWSLLATGSGSSAAGASTQIQFNTADAFDASEDLTYDGTSVTVADPATDAIVTINPNFGGVILSNSSTNVTAIDFRDDDDNEQATWTTTIDGVTVIADYGPEGIILQTDGGDAITLPAKGGFIPQLMTTTARDAVVSPAEGMTIYNSTTHTLNFYNGSAWKAVTTD